MGAPLQARNDRPGGVPALPRPSAEPQAEVVVDAPALVLALLEESEVLAAGVLLDSEPVEAAGEVDVVEPRLSLR